VPSVVSALRLNGGRASTAELLESVTYREIRAALAAGSIVRLRHGLSAMSEEDPATQAAILYSGVVSHANAADYWDFPVLNRPDVPHVTVPPHRKRRPGPPVHLHWADLAEDDQDGLNTSPLRTVLDCSRTMPFPEALAIADKAVRADWFGKDVLVKAAGNLRGAGGPAARKVAAAVDVRAESGLESALRAILLDGGLTGFEPQLPIHDGDFRIRADLGHPEQRLALEADSFEHHGTRQALVGDCWRYDELLARGWRVLRFSFEHILGRPDWVLEIVQRTLRFTPPAVAG
jgi:very-short-patch-repair endonuclease